MIFFKKSKKKSEPSAKGASKKERAKASLEDDVTQNPEFQRLLSYQAAAVQGQGTRSYQEDSFAVVNADDVTEMKNKGLLAVVADGMGGLSDGKAASETACAAITKDFEQMDMSAPIAPQLYEMVMRSGKAVYSRFGGKSGTTLVACIIYGEKLTFASVGDSCLYLCRSGGIYRLNREQNYKAKLYMEQIRKGFLSCTQADADEDGQRLSEFLGRDCIEDVDLLNAPMQLYGGDTLLICSDGVGGVLDESEMAECLEATNPSAACDMIRQKVLMKKRLHQDNFTALVIQCKY